MRYLKEKTKLIVLLIIIATFSISCCREKECKEFDKENLFMAISISPDSEDELTFENKYGGIDVFTIDIEYYSLPYSEEQCGYIKYEYPCVENMSIRYNSNISDDFFDLTISKHDDNCESGYTLKSNNLSIEKGYYYMLKDSKYIDDLLSDKKDDKAIVYESILEIIDTTFAKVYVNTLDTLINSDGSMSITGQVGYLNDTTNYSTFKMWIQKDKGMIKYWKNDTCWSKKQE